MTGTAVANKTYDGTDVASLSGGTLVGVVGSENVTLTQAGTFADKNAGTGKLVTAADTLGGTDMGNYILAQHTSLRADITPKAISLNLTGITKVYDGQSTYNASASELQTLSTLLGVSGDSVTNAVLILDNKNVGTGKSATMTSATLSDGNNGQNYSVTLGSNSNSSVTRLSSVTWVGGSTGNWFDPANWAGGAVPDLNNVANVVIPNGITVSFNTSGIVPPAQLGTVSIDSLGVAGGNLTQTSGTLDVGSGGITLGTLSQLGGNLSSQGAVTLTTFNQSGGSSTFNSSLTTTNYVQSGGTTTANSLTVNGSYNQTGGQTNVTGNANVTTNGTMTLSNLTVGGALHANATNDGINQMTGTQINVTGRSSFYAPNGVISLNSNKRFPGGNSIIDRNGDRNRPQGGNDWVFQQIMVQGGTMVHIPLPKNEVGQSKGTHKALAFTGEVVLLDDEIPDNVTDPRYMSQPEAGFTDRFFGTAPRITLLPETDGRKLVQQGDRLFIVNTDNARGRLDQEPAILPKPGLRSSTPKNPVSGTAEKISLLAQ